MGHTKCQKPELTVEKWIREKNSEQYNHPDWYSGALLYTLLWQVYKNVKFSRV